MATICTNHPTIFQRIILSATSLVSHRFKIAVKPPELSELCVCLLLPGTFQVHHGYVLRKILWQLIPFHRSVAETAVWAHLRISASTLEILCPRRSFGSDGVDHAEAGLLKNGDQRWRLHILQHATYATATVSADPKSSDATSCGWWQMPSTVRTAAFADSY